ncbi:hypothetical protein, partial [Clostridium sp.]|uniref:hypothetical protein n=1 Tax=Clostridium sp. TaxID=1506 RepID=UPI00346476C5
EISKMDKNNINPYTLSAVINGLKAIGQDPLSDDFKVGDKNIVELLLNFRKGDRFEFNTEGGIETTMITEQGLLALSDILKDKSVFNKTFDFSKEEGVDNKDKEEVKDTNNGNKEEVKNNNDKVNVKEESKNNNGNKVTDNNATIENLKAGNRTVESSLVAANNSAEENSNNKEELNSLESNKPNEESKDKEDNKEETSPNSDADKEATTSEDKKEKGSNVNLSSYKKNMMISLVALGAAVLLIAGYFINKKKAK